jgi:hypothetical protein
VKGSISERSNVETSFDLKFKRSHHVACDCHSKRKETAKSTSRSCSLLSPWMRSPLPCPPLSHPLSHLPHLSPILVAVFLSQAVRDTLELSPSLCRSCYSSNFRPQQPMVLPSQLRHVVSLKMQTHMSPMLTIRGTRLKHASALFLSPMMNSMAKRCASSTLHWRLATELILNFPAHGR